MTVRPELTARDVGCYASSNHGEHSNARMIMSASSFGYGDDDEQQQKIVDLAQSHYDTMVSDAPKLSDADLKKLSDAADSVVKWLNENVAPEGHEFGWHEGNFMLWSDDAWAEVAPKETDTEVQSKG